MAHRLFVGCGLGWLFIAPMAFVVSAIMRVVVVETVFLGDRRYGLFERQYLTAFGLFPTLHARQIAAITPDDIDVRVVSERFGPLPFDGRFDIAHVNFSLSTTVRAFEIADEFRRRGVFVVMSGYLCNVYPDEVLIHADCVLQGRGELEWLAFLEDRRSGDIKTLYGPVRYDDSTVLPATKVDVPGFAMTGAIEATRGCPYRCDFCMESCIADSPNYYRRPVEEVVDEIAALPQRMVLFYDTSLTVDVQYSCELFEALIPLRKHFFCNGNADVLSEDIEFVRLSKKAGCVSWLVGFESFSKKSLSGVGKSTNRLDGYASCVNNVHESKMGIVGSFIFGFDGEETNVFASTLDKIESLGIDACDFNVLTPFPGTPLFERMDIERRIISKEWSRYTMKDVVFEPRGMSREEIVDGVRWIYERFYAPRSTIGHMARCFRYGIYPGLMVGARMGIASLMSHSLKK